VEGRKSIFTAIGPFLLVLGAIVLVGIGLLIGVLIDNGDSESPTGAVRADEIGNVADGRELFVSQGCAMCHTYEGQGGTDAPSLDFMKGRMTANDIANMSGRIWNHVPQMEAAFAEEGVPFPEFTGNQMASLIAYLHGGGPPPEVEPEAMMGAGDEHGGESGEHMSSEERGHTDEE